MSDCDGCENPTGIIETIDVSDDGTTVRLCESCEDNFGGIIPWEVVERSADRAESAYDDYDPFVETAYREY